MQNINHKNRITQIIIIYALGWGIAFFFLEILHWRDSEIGIFIITGTIISIIMLLWYLIEWLLPKLKFLIKEKQNKSLEENLLRIHQLFEKELITRDEYNSKIKRMKENHL